MSDQVLIILLAILAAVGGYPLIRTMQVLGRTGGFVRRLLLGFVLQTAIVTVALLAWALMAYTLPTPRPPYFRTLFLGLFIGQYILLVAVNWWVYRNLFRE